MRYIVGIFITIGLIVLIFVLLLRGGSPSSTSKSLNLGNYLNNSSAAAELLIDGPIVAEQNHQQIDVTVTLDHVTLTTYKGYQQDVIRTRSFANNQNAYANFLLALQKANFTNGNNDAALKDERGFCPNGSRYIITFSDGNNTLERYWASTCGQGTYKGNLDATLFLFRNQVPNYDDLTANINFPTE